MRILCDVDGVFADFTKHALASIGESSRSEEEFTSWDMLSHFSQEVRDTCTRIWREQSWCAEIPPYPEALDSYQRLSSIGKIVWVTAPMVDAPYWCHERTLWLQKHFGAKLQDIVFTHDKAHVWGDVLIDDRVENILGWSEIHANGFGLLWDRPYNRNVALPQNTQRVHSWGGSLCCSCKEKNA